MPILDILAGDLSSAIAALLVQLLSQATSAVVMLHHHFWRWALATLCLSAAAHGAGGKNIIIDTDLFSDVEYVVCSEPVHSLSMSDRIVVTPELYFSQPLYQT